MARVPNIYRPVFEPSDGPVAHAALGRLAGARGLDVRLYRLEPGDAIAFEGGTERLMVVTRGGPSVDAGGRGLHLTAGDVWVWPESRQPAVSNLTGEVAEVLILVPPEQPPAPRRASARRRGSARAPASGRP